MIGPESITHARPDPAVAHGLHLPRGDASTRRAERRNLVRVHVERNAEHIAGKRHHSSKAHAGRPDTLAMPVATLVMCPPPGHQSRRECFRPWPFRQTTAVKTFWSSQVPCLGSSLGQCFLGLGLRLGLGLGFGLGSAFGFRLGSGLGSALASGLGSA